MTMACSSDQWANLVNRHQTRPCVLIQQKDQDKKAQNPMARSGFH